jgi:hypothetical protein
VPHFGKDAILARVFAQAAVLDSLLVDIANARDILAHLSRSDRVSLYVPGHVCPRSKLPVPHLSSWLPADQMAPQEEIDNLSDVWVTLQGITPRLHKKIMESGRAPLGMTRTCNSIFQ